MELPIELLYVTLAKRAPLHYRFKSNTIVGYLVAAFGWAVVRSNSWSMMLGGDIMLNGVRPSERVFKGLEGLIKPATIRLGNLEIPPTSSTTATSRKTPEELRARQQYILKADPEHMTWIKKAGFDLVSMANNHAMDYGPRGLLQVIGALDSAKIGHAGAGRNATEAQAPTIYKLPNGQRVGLISSLAFMSSGSLRKCTPATSNSHGIHVLSFGGSINDASRGKLSRWIGKAKNACDVLVVALHWGIERQTIPTPYQVALGRACVDAGADVVWGHHPHVIQGAEWYKGKAILYSMGNLVSSTPAKSGFIRLDFEKSGPFRAQFHPTLISGGQVSLSSTDLTNFPALCMAIQKRFGVPESRALTAGK